MAKKRFGVSLPEELATSLDELASRLGVDRSRLIAEVIREFIHDRVHVLTPHQCRGVLVVVSSDREANKLSEVYERRHSFVKARMHCHSEGSCIDVLFVEASSDDIIDFERELRSLRSTKVRYMPLSWVF